MRRKLIFIIAISLFLWIGFVQALEITYPVLPGVEAPQEFMSKIASGEYSQAEALGLMARYLYILTIFFAGSICTLAMIYGGIIYFFSGNNPGKVVVAKDQIVSAFFGALLLATSFMILKLINPDLLILNQPAITHPVDSFIDFIPPEERIESYWELPMGKIEAAALDATKKMEAPSLAVKDASAIVKNKTEELKTLVNLCQCSELTSICSIATCTAIDPCAGTYAILCPNSNLIDAKKAEVLTAAADLQVKTNILKSATIALFSESSKLQAAKRIMENCEGEATDLYSYQTIREVFITETKYIWSETGYSGGSSIVGAVSLPSVTGSCRLSNTGSPFSSIPNLNNVSKFRAIVEAAAQTIHVPPSLILGVMYGEGIFNPGRYEWTNENVEAWSCEGCGVPNCDISPFQSEGIWDANKDAIKKVAPGRIPSPCNLLDVTFATAQHLSSGVSGFEGFNGIKCFGILLNDGQSINTADCSWARRDIETAIKVWESGYMPNLCFTNVGSCATGGGMAANCPGNDTCEHYGNCFGGGGSCSSHNYCIWGVTNHYK